MLTVYIYRSKDSAQLLASYAARLTDDSRLRFSTNEHGFQACELLVEPVDLHTAFGMLNWPGTPHVVVADESAAVVWEGRLEDFSIEDDAVSLLAFGYQRALGDIPYTAAWSLIDTSEFEFTKWFGYDPQFYEGSSDDDKLYIALRKGETYVNSGAPRGAFTWAVPYASTNQGNRDISTVSFDYTVRLPTNWRFRVEGTDQTSTSGAIKLTVTGDGNLTSSSSSLTSFGYPRVEFYVYNNSGSDTTVTNDTGYYYVEISNLRIKTTSSSTVLASEVAADLVDHVNSQNSDQISAATALIETTTIDMQDYVIEDEYPNEILNELAERQGLEWAVWENQLLQMRSWGSGGRTWYVDATRIVGYQRSLQEITNSAYSIYKEGDREVRTAVEDDVVSQQLFGVVRRGSVSSRTTSATQAEAERDAWLSSRATIALRANVEFETLYSAGGTRSPLYRLRAGDRLVIRNLPVSLSGETQDISEFVIGETEYDAIRDEIKIAPRDPLPTLVTLAAG